MSRTCVTRCAALLGTRLLKDKLLEEAAVEHDGSRPRWTLALSILSAGRWAFEEHEVGLKVSGERSGKRAAAVQVEFLL